MNVNFFFVQMKNIIDQSIIICKNERLNVLIEYEKKSCYLTNSKNRHLIVDFWTKKTLKIDVMTLTTFQNFTFMSSSSFIVNQSVMSTTFISTIFVFAFNQKYVINIDIIVYDTSKVVEIIISMTKVFLNFWQNDDFVVNLFSKKWMFIDLKSDVKSMLFKIYSFDQTNKNFIDQKFDKLQRQNKLKYITQSTSFNYSVFVIWRIIQKNSNESSIRKNKVIINIRKLNKIIKSNIYFISLQTNVIILIVECFYISVFDATNFFHQWLIQIANRYKFIVMSHRDQKQFNVAVMNFKNSSIYVQRKINVILRVYRVFVKIYVNDIVMFNKILKKYLFHLRQIFELLNFFDIRFFFQKFLFELFYDDIIESKNKRVRFEYCRR